MVEWSLDARADLDRFAAFLHRQFPELAVRVAGELITRTACSGAIRSWEAPRPSPRYREIVLTMLGGTYALQYRYDGSSVLMLRVFHGRERR